MAKRYTEELAGWVRERPSARPCQDRNIVAFLAVKADVKAALEAGYAMKTIWAHLTATGRIACRYETFTLHVKRYIRTPPAAGHPLEEHAEIEPPTPAAKEKAAAAV